MCMIDLFIMGSRDTGYLPFYFKGYRILPGISGLENCTRPLVFTSASGCRASENIYISSENYFSPYIANNFVMQGKCLL